MHSSVQSSINILPHPISYKMQYSCCLMSLPGVEETPGARWSNCAVEEKIETKTVLAAATKPCWPRKRPTTTTGRASGSGGRNTSQRCTTTRTREKIQSHIQCALVPSPLGLNNTHVQWPGSSSRRWETLTPQSNGAVLRGCILVCSTMTNLTPCACFTNPKQRGTLAAHDALAYSFP